VFFFLKNIVLGNKGAAITRIASPLRCIAGTITKIGAGL
jgi:hypothetical protein